MVFCGQGLSSLVFFPEVLGVQRYFPRFFFAWFSTVFLLVWSTWGPFFFLYVFPFTQTGGSFGSHSQRKLGGADRKTVVVRTALLRPSLRPFDYKNIISKRPALKKRNVFFWMMGISFLLVCLRLFCVVEKSP